jgi:ATP-dependent RNA helicase RhlE
MTTDTLTATTLFPSAFTDLPLTEPLLRALQYKNYTEPSPIQLQAIPYLLEGKDLIGCAQTGTGKTAAFALPILQKLSGNPKPATPRQPRALILAPTRELAAQIGQSFADYGKYLNLTHTVVFGGVGMGPQIKALARGVDIVIATPGRLMDLERQRQVNFSQVEVFVLDEADRMLDMGFIHEIKRIIAKLPARRQSLLFSATMPPAIRELTRSIVRNPVEIAVAPVSSTVERIDQKVCFIDTHDKRKLLVHLLGQHPDGLVLVFVRMKHMANRVAEHLDQAGIRADAIHGNKSQGARQRALENFRSGHKRILVATDIAARGIDVKGISLVVNYDLPEEPEAYVHRIGRTARAGAEGRAIALCDRSERNLLRNVERLIRKTITELKVEGFVPSPNNGPERRMDNNGTSGQRRHFNNNGGNGRHHPRPQGRTNDAQPPLLTPRPQGQGQSQGQNQSARGNSRNFRQKRRVRF